MANCWGQLIAAINNININATGVVSVLTDNGDGTFTHDDGNGTVTIITTRDLFDADGDTRINLVEGGAAAGGGDSLQFVVDGVDVGRVELLAGGTTKWTLNGIVDPVVFAATPITTAQRDVLPGIVAGYLIYNSDTDCFEYFNGVNWICLKATQTVDESFIAGGSLTIGQDANSPNTILGVTGARTDGGWSLSADAYTYTGTPDHIKIDVSAFFEDPQANTLQRVQPILELLKNGAVVATAANTYQRHGTQHNSSSWNLSWVDIAPSSGDTYSFRSQQGSNQGDVIAIDQSSISLIAIEKRTVF